MIIYTIGFAKKSAEEFFGTLKRAGIKRLIDIRLNNTSQLAGFSKRQDLPFFLKEILGADYVYKPELSPTQEMIDDWKKNKGAWEHFEGKFIPLIAERKIEKELDKKLFQVPAVLLCSEPEPTHCHRRLVAEYLKSHWKGVEIVHL